VHLTGGEIRATHSLPGTAGVTLTSLYLAPLAAMDPDEHPAMLCIDLKTSPSDALFTACVAAIAAHATFNDGHVQFVFTGNRPVAPTAHPAHVVFGSGGGPVAAALVDAEVAVVEVDYTSFSTWNGVAPIPDATKRTLVQLADMAHRAGKMLRVYFGPATVTAWNEFRDAGVDLIQPGGQHPPGFDNIDLLALWFAGGWIFDGENDGVSIGDVYDFERTDSFSLSGRFNSSSATTQNLIGKTSTDTTARGYIVQLRSDGAVGFQLNNDVASGVNSLAVRTTSTAFADGREHHFLITYNGTSAPGGVVIYIDGQAEALTTINNSLSATTVQNDPLVLGNRQDGARALAGSLREVAVWTGVLSALDAAEIHDATDLDSVAAGPSLLSWWRFDDDDQAIASGVVDQGGGGFHGTPFGGLEPTPPRV